MVQLSPIYHFYHPDDAVEAADDEPDSELTPELELVKVAAPETPARAPLAPSTKPLTNIGAVASPEFAFAANMAEGETGLEVKMGFVEIEYGVRMVGDCMMEKGVVMDGVTLKAGTHRIDFGPEDAEAATALRFLRLPAIAAAAAAGYVLAPDRIEGIEIWVRIGAVRGLIIPVVGIIISRFLRPKALTETDLPTAA